MHLCKPIISSYCLCFSLSILCFVSLARSGSFPIVTEAETETEIHNQNGLSFDWSSHNKNNPPISLLGAATLANSVVRLSPTGTILYDNKPIEFSGNNPGFSTHFSFSFSAIKGNRTELSFFLSPINVASSLQSNNALQLPPNTISVAIDSGNKSENFLKINVGGHLIAQSSGLSSTDDEEKLNCLIQYNGITKRMQIRITKSTEDSTSIMTSAMLSYPVDLTQLLLKHDHFTGMRYSCENSDESVSIFSWSFSTEHGAKHPIHSEPLDPRSFVVQSTEDHHRPSNHKREHHYYSWCFAIVMLVVTAACVAFMMWYTIVSRWKAASMEVSMNPIEAGYEKIFMFEGESVKGFLELENLK